MRLRCGTILAGCAVFSIAAFAGTSCKDGVAKAVWCGAADGNIRPPAIDGDLSDWNRSAPVLVWHSEESAEEENATLFFMYDETNLYVAYDMTLPGGRVPKNENRTCDRFWRGDIVQLRLCTDKSVGWPLPKRNDARLKKNPRIACVNLWRDTKGGIDYCHITPGAMFDCPALTNPEGSAVKSVSVPGRLVFEARIPWSALGVADGRCPFAPGEMMPAVVDVKWAFDGSVNGHASAAIYRKPPGVFAFMNIDTWGQIEFLPSGTAETRSVKCKMKSVKLGAGDAGVSPAEFYAEVAARAKGPAGPDKSDWAKIEFELPKRAKVSVNIFDEKGAVVRELVGGEWRDAGLVEVRWDGRDALGFPCDTGRDYRWGVYAHDGLDVVYEGTVGTSGEPPYETPDGTGGWGADHGPPVACAADDSGRYFVWHKSEQGSALVKTDFDGKVVWRANPFVRGGWGDYTAACAADGMLWLVHGAAKGKANAALVKIDGATGRHKLFSGNRTFAELPVEAAATNLPPKSAVRPEFGFNCVGIAVKGGSVYVSDRNGDRIVVADSESGEVVGEIAVDKPRGIAFAPDGALWAVSGKGVVRMALGERRETLGEKGDSKTIDSYHVSCLTSEDLSNPYALAIGSDGTLYVSDLGDSQQVKVFSGDGKMLRAYGKRGGRGYLGKIDYDAFLMPFGLAVDRTGALLVAEASSPKIVTILDAATGEVRRRYVGHTAYSPSNIPDCDDPLLLYYSISGPGSFARQRLGECLPDAAWDFAGAGIDEVRNPLGTMQMPRIFRAPDGRKYLAPDAFAPNGDWFVASMLRIEGDSMVPAAAVMTRAPLKKGEAFPVSLWCDRNGDGVRQDDECSEIPEKIGGRSFSVSAGRTPVPGVIFVDDDGTLFILARENAVIGVPCRGFSNGTPLWDAASAYVAIPEIVPGQNKLIITHRLGLRGIMRDSNGNFYGSLAWTPEYASPGLQKAMAPGMGHTSLVGGVFVCKWAPYGTPVWRVGRKATGGLKPGEMLHHWNHAGMVGDGYTVAGSEWGVFTVYTADGFFVDSLFDPPGVPGRGGPYVFGGEDFSGRIQAFPERGEVWAYNAGHAFRVKGFEKCRVAGEWRTNGVVRLERVAPLFVPGAKPKPLEKAKIERVGGKVVFTAHVVDDTPLVNTASDESAVFKGGDAVGFELGPRRVVSRKEHKGHKETFTRILAARISGKDRVIAMKPYTKGEKRPQEYTTPAGGTAAFDFVGDAPDAAVAFSQTDDGYDVRIEVPETLFELDVSKPVFWDAEALFSGDGGRGVGTVKRVYLYNRETSQTSMVDDTPTEARLHPEGYAEVQL